MGYGHQRAAYPLKDMAYERIINSNSDKIVTRKERKTWHRFRAFYEGVSRMRSIPFIGEFIWKVYDHFQRISPFYPFRDLSRPTFGSIYMHRMIRKGFLKSIADYTKRKNIPFVSTFFAPALAAAHAGLDDVYCVVTDTDINRAWVPEFPKKEKLYYLTPTEHSTKRLVEYGVPEKNIFFTGFPLPKENIGSNLEILKHDLGLRLANVDPKRVYVNRYKLTIKKQLGKFYKSKSNRPLTITYCVGGAGAQREIAYKILKSLKKKIMEGSVHINLIAGTRVEVQQYFFNIIKDLKLNAHLDKNITVQCALDKKSYFEQFNQLLRTTDILWTKPSELSFYTALGLPIIISPPLGSHEIMNQKWLVRMGSGFPQEDPEYCSEWLFEWLDKGILGEAAWEGFTEAPKFGTFNIEKVIFTANKKSVKFRY